MPKFYTVYILHNLLDINYKNKYQSNDNIN